MKHLYTALGNHTQILEYLKNQKTLDPSFTVLDVGASDNPWTDEVLDATFDFKAPYCHSGVLNFNGNLNDAESWKQLLDYVSEHGKFSYSVCAHTLEDIAYPALALKMLPLVSKAGFISMPSHYRELTIDIEGPWRGYIHHRWLFRVKDGSLILIPKVSFLEYQSFSFDCPAERTELQLRWEDTIPYSIINGDYLGPNVGCVIEMYKHILNDN